MKLDIPAAEYPFRYRNPPRSGNDINGLGVLEARRPVQIFHSSGRRRIEWELLELYFLLTMPFRLFMSGLVSRWKLRLADGTTAPQRTAVIDLDAMSTQIKARARSLGAAAVGIGRILPEALYQNYETPFRMAISIACPMDYEEMMHVTHARGGIETMRAYNETTRVAVALAAFIRDLGWPARAYCESADLLHIPLAINAGLGELGKHGSLINRELGSNFRLATVLTDLPLTPDEPMDIGVDDLCTSCRRCTTDCPADAISDDKQMVRGVEKWYVDFDRCVPYFTKTFGCGICIQVCPWTRPGRGPSLSEKLLSKRAAGTNSSD